MGGEATPPLSSLFRESGRWQGFLFVVNRTAIFLDIPFSVIPNLKRKMVCIYIYKPGFHPLSLPMDTWMAPLFLLPFFSSQQQMRNVTKVYGIYTNTPKGARENFFSPFHRRQKLLFRALLIRGTIASKWMLCVLFTQPFLSPLPFSTFFTTPEGSLLFHRHLSYHLIIMYVVNRALYSRPAL